LFQRHTGAGSRVGQWGFSRVRYQVAYLRCRFPRERISQEYFWLWFAAIFSILLYIPLFFLSEFQGLLNWRSSWLT